MADSKRATLKGKRDARRNLDWRRALGLHDDFPLFQHQNGRWAKKVRGTLHYFGKIDYDPKGSAALDLWNEQKHALIAGRKIRKIDGATGGVTIRDICNRFLEAKRTSVAAGSLHSRTFVEYGRTAKMLVEQFGATRTVSDLGPDDFQSLYAHLTKTHKLATIGREVTMVRSVFKFAVDADMVPHAVKFGPTFRGPSKKDKRVARAKAKRKNGNRMFDAVQIKRVLNSASPQLKAMILLGINGGLGNTDCATLTLSALDLKAGWLDLARLKTGIERRIPLWPETIKALKAVIAARKNAKDDEHRNLVFLTRLGQPWVRYELNETPDEDGKLQIKGKSDDAIAKATGKLLRTLGIYRPGVTFYALRHTFETIAGGCADQVAVDAVMGHVDPSQAEAYREYIDDARLKAVTSHVHQWLYGAK
jgi:integrase